ncbi:leucine-rich repeat-containing protein let-4-like protein, partial [Leptotrombidium deliense]
MPIIRNDLISDLSAKHIIIHHCNLSHIEDSSFIHLRDRLESLDMSHNALSQVRQSPVLFRKHLFDRRLLRRQRQEGRIKTLKDMFVPSKPLEVLSSLVSLNLNFNNIESIHAEAFKGLVSLLRLTVYGNKIKSIDSNAFLGIGGNISRINLGANLLPSVPSQSLVNLTTLKKLQLHENKITALQKHEFKGIFVAKSLDVLSLSTNLLRELPEKAFQNLGALNSLDLEGNSISSIHQNAFEGIEDSLEWITLGDNHLLTIPSFALRNVTKLRQLDLRNNNITRITVNCLDHFGKNLKFLYLQENK